MDGKGYIVDGKGYIVDGKGSHLERLHAVVGDLGHGGHGLGEGVEHVVEVVLGQQVQLAVLGGRHIRSAVDTLDETDLPEIGSRVKVGDHLIVSGHLDLPVPGKEQVAVREGAVQSRWRLERVLYRTGGG
eukprot:8809057-Pyramimonas_sp.AAC.1